MHSRLMSRTIGDPDIRDRIANERQTT